MTNSTSFPIGTIRSPTEIHVQAVTLALLCIGGILGNMFVVSVIAFNHKLHKPTFYFIVSLAAADFLVGAAYIPSYMASVLEQQWKFSISWCHTHAATISMSLNASLMTLGLVSLDRYFAITNPLRYQVILTARRSVAMIALGWVHSIFWAVTPLMGWGEIVFDPKTCTCRPNWGAKGLANKVYAMCLALFAFTIPTVAMIYSYVKIFQVARYHIRLIKKNSIASDSNNSGNLNAQETKALKTVLLVIGGFVVSWLPYSVSSLGKLLSKGSWTLNATAANAVLTITLLNGCVNPVIYSIRDKRFRRGFRKILCPCMPQQSNEFNSYMSTVAGTNSQNKNDAGLELEIKASVREGVCDAQVTNTQ